jgi:hypothetical protein
MRNAPRTRPTGVTRLTHVDKPSPQGQAVSKARTESTRARWLGIAVLVAVLLFVVYTVRGVTDAFSNAPLTAPLA